MPAADWYFDFVSPFSWLALHRLESFDDRVEIHHRPVLFAAILDHWGHRGPAEIAPKRLWAYRTCLWQARRDGIPMRFPASHPFNPLPYLRLCITAGSTRDAVTTIFRALWTTGADPADPALPERLAMALNVDPNAVNEPDVKQALHRETAAAVDRGVFGVPTLIIDRQLYWGTESMDFASAALDDPAILNDPEMQRLETLPVGASRKRG